MSNTVQEAKELLDLLPDPNMNLHPGVGPGVYAGSNVETSSYKTSGKPLIKLADCEVDDCASLEDVLSIHDPTKLDDADILKEDLENEEDFEDYLKEMGTRHSQFFAGAPEIIRKLIAELEAKPEKL